MHLVDITDLHGQLSQHDGIGAGRPRDVADHVDAGESLGIVGESGSGKSVTCMAALRLLRQPPSRITADRLALDGTDMLTADKRDLSHARAGRRDGVPGPDDRLRPGLHHRPPDRRDDPRPPRRAKAAARAEAVALL
jgi:ABC-type glutathione transport system ATPase component